MDKALVVQEIIKKLETDLEVLVTSAKAAHDAATHEESKAEDKYDTRGLEASYLAGAQSKRAAEIQAMITEYRRADLGTFTARTPIAVTALVEVEGEGKRSWYFLTGKGGGDSVKVGGHSIHVISVHSPVGAELVGRTVGEEFEVRLASGQRRDLEIVDVS